MCNDFGNNVPYSVYVEEFSHLRLPVTAPPDGAVPNLEPRDEIWPTDAAVVLRPGPGGVALEQHPWGLAPGRAGARAVINMRAEGRRFVNGAMPRAGVALLRVHRHTQPKNPLAVYPGR